MSALCRCAYGLAIPIFLIVKCSSVLDAGEELLREQVELLQECYSVEGFDTGDREILDSKEHTRDDESKECHRYHEFEDSESFFISATRSCDHRDER